MRAELLAPAGSADTVKAAFAMGADAVYIGGQHFGARAYAENAGETDLIRCMDLAHLLGRKLYLTVNTLLKNDELEQQLYPYLLPLYRAGLDGIIVQDPGVIAFCREHFPELPLHASTQMTITGPDSAAMLKEQGLTRVVPARELSLAEIREIREKTGLEIECFIHGALCYSYSGQCLMSSMIGGRSGNRGRCAGTCRLPYDVYKKGKRLGSPSRHYPLNTKDMCTLELLPQILEAGVYSLKIEGRMKRPEYTAGVVSIYRKYLDICLEKEKDFRVDPADLRFLYDLFNRDGFHQSYFFMDKGPEMMALKNEKLTRKVEEDRNQMYGQLQKEWQSRSLQRKIRGELYLQTEVPSVLQLTLDQTQVTVCGAAPEAAKAQPMTGERILKQMQKTGNEDFCFESLELQLQDALFLPVRELNELRRKGMAELRQTLLEQFRREEAGAHTEVQPEVSQRNEAGPAAGADGKNLSCGSQWDETVPETENDRKTSQTGRDFAPLDEKQTTARASMVSTVQILKTDEDPEDRRASRYTTWADGQENLSCGSRRDEICPAAETDGEDLQVDGGLENGRFRHAIRTEDKNSGRLPLWAHIESREQFQTLCGNPEICGIGIPLTMLPAKNRQEALEAYALQLEGQGQKLRLILPYIARRGTGRLTEEMCQKLAALPGQIRQLDAIVVKNMEQASALAGRVPAELLLADAGLYTMNDRSINFWQKQGIGRNTQPWELNFAEMMHRNNQQSELIIYGAAPMMISEQCLQRNLDRCNRKNEQLVLLDRKGKEFPVACVCACCYNVIYNCLPQNLLQEKGRIDRLGCRALRLSFTTEGGEETRRVAEQFIRVFRMDRAADPGIMIKGTRGHFRRGVQ